MIVLTSQLLRLILMKPDILGRVVQWPVELNEFNLKYRLRMTIKAQALADFIIEQVKEEQERMQRKERTNIMGYISRWIL